MKVKAIEIGEYKTNCYILEKENNILIIDPGAEFEKIEKEIGKNNVVGILLTHSHFDHIGAVSKIINKYKCELYDYYNLEEKKYKISNFDFEVIFTPGHSSDSITFYFKENKKYFTGDFLFSGTVGRWDFPTGDPNEMKESIEAIKKYEDGKVYPGHGKMTSLNHEIKYNRYF